MLPLSLEIDPAVVDAGVVVVVELFVLVVLFVLAAVIVVLVPQRRPVQLSVLDRRRRRALVEPLICDIVREPVGVARHLGLRALE